MTSHRIHLAMDADSKTIFIVPYGNAFLRVVAWLTADGDYEGENIIQVDLYGDKRCARLIAEEIDWVNLADLDNVFLEIRRQQFERDDKARRERGLRRLIVDLRADEADLAAARMWSGA
jgi:hypothetical protein